MTKPVRTETAASASGPTKGYSPAGGSGDPGDDVYPSGKDNGHPKEVKKGSEDDPGRKPNRRPKKDPDGDDDPHGGNRDIHGSDSESEGYTHFGKKKCKRKAKEADEIKIDQLPKDAAEYEAW